MNAPKARSLAAKAPEKGSFPLDHGGTCKIPMKDFQNCIKNNKGSHALCREFSKKYLTCRMENNLMAKEDLSDLGFTNAAKMNALAAAKRDTGPKKEKTGFIAGMNIKGERSR
jgi:cytochrome c oxidase assembly protein subunit 19